MRKIIFKILICSILVFVIFGIINPIPALAITREEAINIAKDFANNALLPEEEKRLAQEYSSTEAGEIKMLGVDILTKYIEKIVEQALWEIPLYINYQITKAFPAEGISKTTLPGQSFKIVYIDDITATVLPELSKISHQGAFNCSNRQTELCDGLLIYFDREFVTTYSWVESNILEEICISQEMDEGEFEDELVYQYVEEGAYNWNKAKENILNVCQTISSVVALELEEDEGDYFRFNISPQNKLSGWRGVISEQVNAGWLERGLVYVDHKVSLKFEKGTGKILEQRKSFDLSGYENTLLTKHNGEKRGESVFLGPSIWYVPPVELKNIVKYDWILKIEPNWRVEAETPSEKKQTQPGGQLQIRKENNTIWYMGISAIVIIFAFVLWRVKKKIGPKI